MRKVILLILLIIVGYGLKAQTKVLLPATGSSNAINHNAGAGGNDSVTFFPTGSGYPSIDMTNYLAKVRLGALQYDSTNHFWWSFDPSTGLWDTLQSSSGGGGGGGGETILPAGPFVTENIHIAYDPGTNLTAAEIIQKVWYATRPSATLTGGTTLELTNASTVSQTLNWGAHRQVGATTLSTIIVAGVSQSFSQPAAGGTVSGTQAVSVPANVPTTYSNVVTALDGQTATATTTFNFLGKRYYGLLTDTTGITAGSLNSTIIALANSFASTKVLSVNTGVVTGTEFWCYAYPSVLGDLSSLTFNEIPALEAMNKITLSITNALGYTQNYTVYYNRQGQTTSSDIATE